MFRWKLFKRNLKNSKESHLPQIEQKVSELSERQHSLPSGRITFWNGSKVIQYQDWPPSTFEYFEFNSLLCDPNDVYVKRKCLQKQLKMLKVISEPLVLIPIVCRIKINRNMYLIQKRNNRLIDNMLQQINHISPHTNRMSQYAF